MAGTRDRCILPLPPDVVAQIKSSTAIVSLTGVVLELLKNALDAGATGIEATVDFGRGSCAVEDDGRGIAPLEFRDEGGLGKLHCTSKYYSDETCLGRHGTFLASLAAMSLLTITSHHHEHRSHNSITFHHSKPIERQLPAPPQLELSHQKHGTRVTVRNLFGNLPVRVKQRAMVVEQKAKHDRLWDTLSKDVTGLMLSWRGSVSFRLRDADTRTVLNLNGRSTIAPAKSHVSSSGKPRSSELQFILNILTQSNYITIDDWSAWIAVSASTPNISINGAISLEPAPTKRIQFFSFDVRPLSSDAGHNELYDEVNRVFALSSFGTVDDVTGIDEAEKIRRQNDGRFKNDGYTNRQLRGRKGVDRYPMFHLRISLKDSRTPKAPDDKFLENEANLQAVVEVLNAMITQWLSTHHFRPRKRNVRQDRPDTASTSASDTCTQIITPSQRAGQRAMDRETPNLRSSRLRSPTSENRKRKRSAMPQSRPPSERTQQLFTGWSRIKSAKPSFYDTAWSTGKQGVQKLADSSLPGSAAIIDDEAILPRALITPSGNQVSSGDHTPTLQSGIYTDEDTHDDTMVWIDPTTKEKFLLNTRTGCAMPPKFVRAPTDSPAQSITSTPSYFRKSLRIRPKSAGTEEDKNSWLRGLLQNWENPIFKPAEQRIQKVSLEENQMDAKDHRHSNHFGCSKVDIDKAFNGSSLPSANRLSKAGLRNAHVIAQLDKKFVLVKMSTNSDKVSCDGDHAEVLVLIDQHAADERIRVEELFSGLCAPILGSNSHSQYRSKLGHKALVAIALLEKPLQFNVSFQEEKLFINHALRFAAWGILYDSSVPKTTTAKPHSRAKEQPVLSVTSLPLSIFERCKADPQLLISFLRSTVWKYAEDPHLSPLHSDSPSTTESRDEDSPLWLRRLATCPQGLIDLLNSRACRSAIMFNDELSLKECEDLVTKLAKCVFPFMCAHGRPSMVPLVDLGHREGKGGLGLDFGLDAPKRDTKEDFVQAWKQWKK